MKRIGMLTSGGDCQALNAAMRGVVKTLVHAEEEVEIYGFLDGEITVCFPAKIFPVF